MSPRFVLTALFACVLQATAQAGVQLPQEPCSMPQTDSQPFTLEELAPSKQATLYTACPSGKNCFSVPMEAGHPIEVFKLKDGWACGYYQSPAFGGGPAWVSTEAIHPVPFSSNPPLQAWAGTWAGGEDRVIIHPSASATLQVKGTAVWHGARDVEHFGDLAASASPDGNKLHLIEGGDPAQSCVVDLTLYGPYIIASDNDLCGGMNVRFGGIWRRVSNPSHKHER